MHLNPLAIKLFYLLLILFLYSCNSPQKNEGNTADYKAYIPFALQMDTLNAQQRKAVTDSLILNFESKNDTANVVWYFLKGYSCKLQGKMDSARLYYSQIHKPQHSEWLNLKRYKNLSADINNTTTISSDKIEQIYNALKKLEQDNSIFTYRYYDLMAKAYFNNGDNQKAKEFSDLYYQNHPFKNNMAIKQRYNSISFLLAERMGDIALMQNYLDSSRSLAIDFKDSVTLMHTYQYEAQVRLAKGQFNESIKAGKIYFNFLQKNNNLNVFDFNNIANLYKKSGEYNTALSYYKQGIEWAAKNSPESNLMHLYGGMRVAYAAKGDYKNAYIALDSVLQLYYKNTEKIQKQKVAKLHTEYETEKKETAIKNLQITNTSNQKIIKQQRWIFVGIAVFLLVTVLYLYNFYRQRLLKEKNKNLESENKKLKLEQKALQFQLNPHFIYNSIANLQGLISREKKQTANAYLLSFSKLIRNILELNRKDFISLLEEIDSLENYIKLQQIRYENTFDYIIDTGILDTECIEVPPMLLQPFVENSIEHGFKNIDYPGLLHIQFEAKNNQLLIIITDNGKSNNNALNKSKQSLSSVITQERLDILYNWENEQAGFKTRNLSDEGKNGYEVMLYIPLEYIV